MPDGLSGSDFQALIEIELDAMTEPELALIRKLCDLWIAGEIRNQPIRSGEHLRCDIGQEKFSEAAAHWKRIAYY